jgi:hypothetical protein
VIVLIILGEEYKSWSSCFLHPPVTSVQWFKIHYSFTDIPISPVTFPFAVISKQALKFVFWHSVIFLCFILLPWVRVNNVTELCV